MSAPRDGCSIVLVVEGEPARFLWATRGPSAPSLRGFQVAPGGLLDAIDDQLPHDGGAHARARVAGLRELFEETGILLAHGSERVDDDTLGELRDALLEGESDAVARFEGAGLRFRTAELVPIGRWITPAFAPVRYDTRFFAMRLTRPIEPSLDLRELDEAEWVEAPEALARFSRAELLMTPPITALIRDLSADGRLDAEALRAVHGARAESSQRWEVVPHVQMLPFRTPTLPPATHTNSFLIGSGEVLLVEPATPDADERERMLAWVEEARRDGLRPVGIFLTHHHLDHVGAAAHLQELLELPLLGHAMTAQRLEGRVHLDRLIEPDERIVLAGPTEVVLRAIHTPGHAPGHLCLLEEASRVLIAGDMVASEGSILVEPSDGDMTLYLDSLRAMKALGASMLLPAHGMPIRDVDGLLDHFIAHRLDRERKVRGALGAGPAQIMELVPIVYADTPPFLWPLAAQALEAHLIKLERDGMAARDGSGWSSIG